MGGGRPEITNVPILAKRPLFLHVWLPSPPGEGLGVRALSHSIAAALLLVLAGCEQAPPAPDAAQVIEQSKQAVRETEAAIAEIQKSTAEVTAKLESAKPKNDPLKDVAPPGPVVPYFNR